MKDKRIAEMERVAREQGLDFFPVVFETVTEKTMQNVCAYGLPTRARHWSYGRSYDHQKTYGEMGLSKIYEMIVNNNPSYAFMLDTNSPTQNLFIAAHCFGHSDFFKNNVLFKDTDRNMVRHAAEHAHRVDTYIDQYGIDAVERMMDIGFALDRHIDVHKGQFRRPYPRRHVEVRKRPRREFDDLLRPQEDRKLSVERKVVNATLPPHPEKDLLWFLINYAPLEEWERDVLDIIREEAFYFYPQAMTKIMNEGWASYWHAELMYLYDGVRPEEQIEFARTHEKVVQPGGNPFRVNPYYIGFRIFKDIEKRWDELHEKGESDITGREKIFQVRAEESDISFLRNYLTDELVRNMNLFTFGQLDEDDDRGQADQESTFYEIKDRVRDEVVETLVRPMYHNYAPRISIVDASAEKLVMEHRSRELGTLDFKYASRTLEYVWELWAAPVELRAVDDDGDEALLCFDESGFSRHNAQDELEALLEHLEEQEEED